MSSIPFTEQQRKAIETSGVSVMVSAAAGSGKTAVLAERCAHFVCDAAPEDRCNADELLVLTFTEAASAEMRTRIVEAIRSRLKQRPTDERLRDQLALMDAAKITTVHSFCYWLVRRWFSDLGIDPAATVLDGDEARLLQSEVVNSIFSDLYEVVQTPDAPFGDVSHKPDSHVTETDLEPADVTNPPSKASLGRAFNTLVDDYGLGEDRNIAVLILDLYGFAMSLPNPREWLRNAYESVAKPKRAVATEVDHLHAELDLQIEHCDRVARSLEAEGPAAAFFADQVHAYAKLLRNWLSELDRVRACPAQQSPDSPDPRHIDDCLAKLESVRLAIHTHAFSRATGPRLSKDADDSTRLTHAAARASLGAVKNRLFGERLKKRFGLFSVDEQLKDLKASAPYLRTIVQLVLAFRDAYSVRKRELAVLDFADLERLAFELLSSEGDPRSPSQAARTLHERFRHVLVDEIQDINPIQDAIIHLTSREADPDRPSNLFSVGDVKQSIYRFRLAEPQLFIQRLRNCQAPSNSGVAISLQSNFRSRPPVLDAVNAVFERLMREDFGGVAYDESARLQVGRIIEPDAAPMGVELHLLEKTWHTDPGTDEPVDRGPAALSDPARWSTMQREGFFIGSRIREWMDTDGFRIEGRPLAFGDVAVLLRARRVNAGIIASMLTSMQIPAFADASGSLLDAKEIRDVLSVLQLIDNARQDIPLAAVLRSGILADRLSVDELLDIRCHDRELPFHDAVRAVAREGRDKGLRERLRALFDRLDYYRKAMGRRPLSDVLWELYTKQGYLAYAGGLPNGAQRRANLLTLHDLARRFGTFRRQGLHRFLVFIRQLDAEKQELPTAPAAGEADNVVRIMSIHQAKGLEFPVVFVAGLGTRFNLQDRSGRMIFERKSGIGLRRVDVERMIEYPTVVHSRVAAEIEASTREEEMRVLYVAMTRARDKLVLVGTRSGVDELQLRGAETTRDPSPPSRLTATTAATPLDWLIPAIDGGTRRESGSLIEPTVHTVDEMTGWRVAKPNEDSDRETRRAVARLEELPHDEPVATDLPEVESVLSRVEFVYPFLASSSVRAVLAASEFKGIYGLQRDPDQQRREPSSDDFSVPESRYTPAGGDRAAQRGSITHRTLQHLNFTVAVDASGLASELHRLVAAGVLSQEECESVDSDSLAWFLSTPLCTVIRNAGKAYRREFMYLSTESLTYVDGSIDAPPEDAVLIRGVVDGVIVHPDGVELLDFKTDTIGPDEVAERCERYRPQLALYARAMAGMWRRPVKACWLVFLGARKIVSLGDLTASTTQSGK